MGVKNNFSQAVSELIGISRTVEPEHNKKELDEEQTDEAMETEANAEEVTEEEGVLQDMADIERENELTPEQKEDAPQTAQNPKERIMAMLAAQQSQTQQPQPQTEQSQPQSTIQPFQQPPRQPKADTGVTTIAKGTIIIGEINADGDVELLGSVKGKIASQGDIKANGKVVGDLIGRDIELIACAVQGNIIASGMVTVDGDSVVIGDVKGENFCLDGKIKGNVSVEKEAKFQPKAILAGNVTTASIAMSQGAKIQGEVNIPLSEKETDMSFDIDMML
ncbi:MAG TPA: polymer-forming cytoskeletal protein [Anaerovoracaceae bacterium]|nr:polymer-forming cytoskeletal protein [Anaerovoracaceae bacterium]